MRVFGPELYRVLPWLSFINVIIFLTAPFSDAGISPENTVQQLARLIGHTLPCCLKKKIVIFGTSVFFVKQLVELVKHCCGCRLRVLRSRHDWTMRLFAVYRFR